MKRLFLSLLILSALLTFGCNSPTKPDDNNGDFWQKTSLSANKIRSLEVGSNNHLFAGTSGTEGSLFRSTDNAKTWETINEGIEDCLISFLEYNSDREYLFAGHGNLLYSTDNGDSWITAQAIWPITIRPAYVAASYGDVIYAGGQNGLSGGSIYPSGSIHWWGTGGLADVYALAGCPLRSCFFAGTGNGVFRLNDGPQQTWNQIGLPDEKINVLAIGPQGEIFAGTENDVFYSSNGSSWQTTGLNKKVFCLAINDNGDVFAGTYGYGVFFSLGNGDWDWEEINSGLSSQKLEALIIDSRGYVYAGTKDQGLFQSTESTE